MAQIVNAEPRVLKWAREERALSVQQAAGLLGIDAQSLQDLEAGRTKPNLTLFRRIADTYGFQYATLAMPEPLPPLPKPKDFRTFEGREATTSLETMLAFEEAVDAQEAIAELVAEDPTLYERSRLARATLEDDPAELAAKQRHALGIADETQLKWRDPRHAYRELRTAVEKRGIFTFEKDMPTVDCRGFSVFEPSSIPIIVVNKGELFPQPKAFTLLHEYAHLLLRDSGLCDENRKNRIERFCNRFAASFLMPSGLVQRIVRAYMIQGREVDRSLVKDAAKRLRVSQQSMALRLEELRYAPRGFYETWLSDTKPEDLDAEQPQPSDKKPIVTWERRKINELGKRYLSLVVDALQHRVVSRPEAFAMMGSGMSSDVFAKVRELIR